MKIAELLDKKPAELAELLATTQKELADARRGLAAGELANPRIITENRKSIARIMTVMSNVTKQEKEA